MANKLSYKQIRTLSATHIVREPEWGPRYLEGSTDGEWEDTDAEFGPAVMTLYPEITPHPKAEAYAVGMGSLVATAGGKQIAVWEEDQWVAS